MELRGGKNPDQDRWFFFHLFFLFFFLAKGSHKREGKEENYNPWFRLSYAGKYIFLISPHAKKNNKTHLELCTDSDYVIQLSAFHVQPFPAMDTTLGL